MNNGSAGLLLLGAKSYKFTKNGFGYSFKYLTWEKNLENPNSSFDFWEGMGGYLDPPIPPHPLPSLICFIKALMCNENMSKPATKPAGGLVTVP